MLLNQQIAERQLLDRIALATTSNNLNMVSHHVNNQRNRKRRRGEIANPANTLDGLVAKRADDIGASESLYKRYLTENEAIEAPSDDQELRRLELDPDVSTRMCSICGYQGKWVSEMIRHKRVHTNERPFRCKYCSRTSKWKADLIRHVAKTHGIRVVSKYSRSKTFDTSGLLMKCRGREENEKDTNSTKVTPLKTTPQTENMDDTKSNSFSFQKPQQLRAPLSYRCALCFFEQASLLILMNHLRSVHSTQPYECRSCGCSFMDAPMTMAHFGKSACSKTDLKINIMPIYATKGYGSSPPSTLLNEAAKRVTQELFHKNSNSEKVQCQQTSVIIRQTARKSDKECPKKQDCPRNHMSIPHTVITTTLASPTLTTDINQGVVQELKKICDNEVSLEESVITPDQVIVPKLVLPDLTRALAALKQQICLDPLAPLHTLAALAAQSHVWTTTTTTNHHPSAFSPTTPNTDNFQTTPPTRLNVIIPYADYDSPNRSDGNSPLSNGSSSSEKDCITVSKLRRNALCSAFDLPCLYNNTECVSPPSTVCNNDDDIIDVVHLDERDD